MDLKRKIYTEAGLTEMLHKASIRPSVQRIAILSYVANQRLHPAAEDIYRDLQPQYPSLSRTTVYNSLHAMTDAGLLRELEIESGNRHYDFAPQPEHSHFMCRRCGVIFDMQIPDGLGLMATPGFSVDSIDLYFKGLCPKCNNHIE